MLKLATLSFDDGTWSDEGIVRVLNGLGVKATFYIVTGWLRRAQYRVRPETIRGLYANHEIGCHTMTHPEIKSLSMEAAEEEIVVAAQRLRDFFSQEVYGFAWPYGETRTDLYLLLEKAGFKWGRTVKIAPAGVEDAKEKWLMPITALLDWEIKSGEWKAKSRIHLIGHGHRIIDAGQLIALRNLICELQKDGFEFVTNAQFYGSL